MRMLKTVLKTIVVLTLLAVVGIAVLLGLLWLDHTRETTLLMPTGPFAVGRTQDAWRDSAHLDPLAPQPDTKRQLVVWIWYPAAPRQPHLCAGKSSRCRTTLATKTTAWGGAPDTLCAISRPRRTFRWTS